MQYVTQVTVSANTLKVNAATTDLKITNGVIHRIAMTFPAGCVGLVGVQLFDGGHPIAPSTAGQWFTGNNRTVEFPEFYEIVGAPRIITTKVYNLDDTYAHTVTVELYVLPKIVVAPLIGLDRMIRAIINVFARDKNERI